LRGFGTRSDYQPVELDKDQKFVFDKAYDLSILEPTVAMHPNPGNRALAKELEKVSLDRAYIGSCTGRLGIDRTCYRSP
jgi:3-isopropylmalate/(R)-2-methylmalate dehydratase large subunit